MRIQHNIMAMNAYRNYTNNVSAMQKNLEKLSSGYKINRAGDDAAGLAISEKMRAQITGLETAQKNAKDGISLVQTAEGALTEVHDMLNRMVELATQSANGTYDNTTDRKQMQKEVDELLKEIDRIADSSNFNGINLLDGSLGLNKEAVTGVEYLSATDAVDPKDITSTVVTFGTVHGKNADSFQSPDLKINLGDVYVQNTSAASATATVTISIGSLDLSAKIKLGAGSKATAGAIATAFATLYKGVKTNAASTASKAIAIGNGYYKLSANGTELELKLAGYKATGGATTVTSISSTANNTDKFTSTMATSFNALLKSGNTVTVGCTTTNFKYVNNNNHAHGLTHQTKAIAEGEAERWGVDITLDADKFMVDGNTIEIDGKTYTISLSSTASKSTVTATGTVKIATKKASNASKQLDAFVEAMEGQSAGRFIVSGKNKNMIHIDVRASVTPSSVASLTATKVKERVKVKDAGVGANNAGVKFTVDDTNTKFTKGDVITVGSKSYVYKGSNSATAFSSAAGLKSMLENDFGSSNVTTVATSGGNGYTFTIRAANAGAAAPMVLGRGLTLQIGDTSDSFNQLNVGVQDMHAVNLGVGGLIINNEVDAQAAIAKIKAAINTVSDVRGTLGATQNRLDHTINNLSVMTENIQDAESTIRDTDVAEEMMAYTKNNILIQSAQAMLAQANQVPQGVLQLLQ